MRWQLGEAGNHLEEIVDHSVDEGPQIIEQDGEGVVVIVPVAAWRAAQGFARRQDPTP